MEYSILVQEIAQKRHAIIKYASKRHTTCYFPYPIIRSEGSEAFLSFREGQDGSLIKVHFRFYSEFQDPERHTYSLYYGDPPKEIPLGESFIAVKSKDRGVFVTRVCAHISLSSFLEIVKEKSFSLFDGKTSRTVDVLPVSLDLALFLASCFGIELLPNEMKDIIAPLIEEEKRQKSSEEEVNKLEKVVAEEEERKKQEEERKRRIEERKKQEEEWKYRENKIREDAKEILSLMWDFYKRNQYYVSIGTRGSITFWIKVKSSEYYLYGQGRATEMEEIKKLTFSSEYIFQLLDLLKKDIIFILTITGQGWSEIGELETAQFIVKSYNDDDSLFDVCSLQQIFDVLDKKTTISSIKESLKKAPSSGGCYIATAVYGSYDCPEVWTLRRFRDQILAVTWFGRLFIKVYYATSPTLVRWFGQSGWFKKFWRKPLSRLVNTLHSKGFDDTPYIDRI